MTKKKRSGTYFSIEFYAPDVGVKKKIIDHFEELGYVYDEDIIEYPYPDDLRVDVQLGRPLSGYASDIDLFSTLSNAINSYGGGEVAAEVTARVRIEPKNKKAPRKKKGKKKPRTSRLRRAMRGT